MCILFSYISRNIKPGEFKLILINNRDEFFHRPSAHATFINDHTLYATDATIGREGGTWLGVSKHGRIACLLNLNSADFPSNSTKKNRGFLVPNYLNSPLNAHEYLSEILNESNAYNPFNLVLYEFNRLQSTWKAYLFNNFNSTLVEHASEYLSLSNHLHDINPFVKTTRGHSLFMDIIEKYNNILHKDKLINSLLQLLKVDTFAHEIEEIQEKLYEDEKTDVRHRIFVNYKNYGTRTHTLILVDDKDRVTFKEFDLQIDAKEWKEIVHEFELI